ncbi:MAG: peptidase M1 [Myxococcales bacterium]|nr:peptidase M1 [Myxococcales bacterium]
MRRLAFALACCATACGGDDAASPDAGSLPPMADPSRDVVATRLAIDLTELTGTATIELAAGAGPGASLEVGDLDVRAVRIGDTPIEFAIADAQLDLGVGADPVAVTIEYGWRYHNNADGVDQSGFTLTWPYYCGNVFPCRSEPRDGTRFELALTGVPAGATAVYPAEITADTAAYQLAWVVGPYQRTSLGMTSAGTEVVVWHHAGEAAAAAAGTKHLRAAFDWMEQHLGPYRFGSVVGSVSAHWGGGAYGGMEHHPLWHVASDALGDESVHVHEAAHGWFGDGIRLACWEDFVLSEGAATYYEARVVEEVGEPGAGAAAWATLDQELVNMRAAGGGGVAWPASCGMVDVLTIFSRVPYVKGALFLRAVERKISRVTFDLVMREFYDRHGGGAAGVTDLVTTIREIGGYDATACAASWLGERAVPTDLTCP